MAVSLTYSSLLTDVAGYCERSDSAFTSQIPTFIMFAENKIIAELKNISETVPTTGNLTAGTATLPKPALWRETISFNITAVGQRVPLLPRLYEYCRSFWPNPSKQAQPRFYADYDASNFLLVPTPDQAYPFELVYFGKVTPLDSGHQTNWFTVNAPQLVLAGTMVEAHTWLKNWDQVDAWQQRYDRSLSALTHEEERKVSDRAMARKAN